ncbi:hypothetical protein GDO86_020208 [Hymenochirus boettgeri]|uniref:Ig-like domain-containing protein n=1 Tax=Hymenochirus boettgeri TaxID=247094 RepID=A0A8T2IFN8_9PIPI|nr:hypothetical protein GDO86_020208 [Hymenochirus boettgeri]
MQNQRLVVAQAGEPVALLCEQDDRSYYSMSWYQHKPGQGLKLMFFSDDANSGDMGKDFTSWTWKRPDVLKSSLSSGSVQSVDSAEYLCTVSLTASRPEHGDGTKPHSESGGSWWFPDHHILYGEQTNGTAD